MLHVLLAEAHVMCHVAELCAVLKLGKRLTAGLCQHLQLVQRLAVQLLQRLAAQLLDSLAAVLPVGLGTQLADRLAVALADCTRLLNLRGDRQMALMC